VGLQTIHILFIIMSLQSLRAQDLLYQDLLLYLIR